MKRLLILSVFAFLAAAHADPQLTSWFTANSGKYARIYASTADETAGTKSLTWTRGTTTQALPTYSGVTEINYSSSWIYIRTTGLASYTMGPWPANFPSFPTNTATIYRIPRVPVIPTTKTGTGLGATGRMVNGVAIYDSRDAFSYSTANNADARPNTAFVGDGIWNRDGDHNEGPTFDPAGAHQASNTYHNHAQPIGLRYQLGDHVDYNSTTNRYTESTTPVTQHSPIVGWAQDGIPVYGPYGYSDPDSAASGVRRMISGFALRDGSNGTTAITVREALPAWAQRVQNKTTLTPAQYGPAVTTAVGSAYLIGHYIEDYDYQGDLAGRVQTKGSDSVGGFVLGNYDLNEQNVRFCVTPEFPSGTWAYFTTIDADNTPAFPYTTGRQFYGTANGGGTTAAVMNADTPLTQYFIGGANTPITVNPVVSTPNVTLTWSAVEGGTYSADASLNQTSWTPKTSGIVAAGTSATTSYATLASTGTEYARVTRTALATYDAAGQTPSTVSQTGLASFLLTGTASAPTVTTPTSASITGGSAVLGGNITSDGGALVTTSGVVVALTSVNSNPAIGGTGVTNITGTATLGVFTVNATGLATNSAYTFKAYATNSAGTSYSTAATFSTLTANLPTITSPTVTNILNSSATLGGNVTSDGGAAITARGVVWSETATNANPLIGGTGVTNAAGTGTTGVFTVNATGIATPAPKNITFKAYATNSAGTVYTAATVFETVTLSSLSNLVLSAGTLSPTFASNTTAYTASVPNSVSSITVTPSMVSGTATVTVNGAAVTPGTASGSITLNVGANTITIVGTQTTPASTKTYTVTVTRAAQSAPLISTPTSAAITATSATLGGNVTSDGGSAVTARGVVLAPTATNSNPLIGGSGVVNVVGTGTTGVFTVNATSLTSGTAYTYKAYATNSLGITYTSTATFSTPSQSGDLSNLVISAGTLTPAFSSATTSYTASVSNAVSSINVTPTALIGTSTITVNSVPVSSGSPIAVELIVGTNPIDVVVTGVDSNVKTYSIVVTRQSGNPVVTSPTATGLSTTTATLGGNVTSDGGTTITARGIVFAPTATNSNPQLGGSGVTNLTTSGTTGVFTVSATGLTLGTSYSFKAYATNSVGTSYSTTGTFTTPRNNILLIIADDFGLDLCKLYNPGGNNATTPNIDSLAANGVRFTNAYAYAVCSPTRSAIITGRYGFRTGTGDVITPGSGSPLQASEFTLPDAFAANASFNYQLKHLGKYHLVNGSNTAAQMSPVTVAGWPSYAGALNAEVADFYNWTKIVTDGTGGGTTSTTTTTYATTDTVNDAVAFINAQTTAGKPWFTWVALNAPHFPFHKPPNALLTTQAYIDLSGTAGDITANRLSYVNAAVQAMDTEIGRLLASVDLNATTVIFIGDNGTDTQVAQSPYSSSKSKGSLYEGGVRVPLIVRGPGVVAPGRTSSTLVHAVDLYRTVLELAGINVATTVPNGTALDSQSLVPILQNQAVSRPLAYSELFNIDTPTFGGQALRDSRYKLIKLKSGSNEFYDLQVDPYEAVNLLAGGVNALTAAQRDAYYLLLADLGTFSTTTPTTINGVTLNPTTPIIGENVTVTANVTPAAGTSISSVVLNYSTGVATTTDVFTETMGTAAGAFTTAANLGANNAWTVNFAAGPPNPFSQTTAANHGAGNAYGLEMNRGTPNLTDNYITTTNNIDASGGTSAYVEFWVLTANLGATNGWTFQTSTNGTTWTTRTTTPADPLGSNHAYQLYRYDLTAGERVSTLKLRFQFAGNGPTNPASRISFDDLKVVTVSNAAPAPISMTSTGGGNYTGTIPGQSTAVSYNILATDSGTGVDYVTGSYSVAAAAPVLAVTPATAFTSSGTQGGGVFTPSSITYTLSNTGTGSLNWTASKTQPWLTLSATSGTLVSGATTNVTGSINTASANALAVGSFSDTITFTNTTNNSGNTTRAASLSIGSNTVPATPAIAALPAYSQGTARTVRWPAVSGATTYTLQISATSNFATVLSSQTVSTPTATFSNLAHGVTYYYRALATNGIGSSSYSAIVSSTQDNVSPTVAITSPSSPQTTATNTITLSGTSSDALSGISKVTVNGATATTSNNFATWSITVPLGFGTNSLTALAIDNAGNTTSSTPLIVTLTTAQTFNPLVIPDIITGTTFNLALKPQTKQFLAGAATNTNAYNDMPFGAPTLIMNKGDWVQMNVTNNLPVDTTTTHWHGFHIPAIMDGGPHQTIPAGTTWSPSWEVMNNAATYWYHPHLHLKTQEQISRGAVGMIIIRDAEEAALILPRTYGVDDIPLALGSRRFTANQIVTAASAYGDVMLVNGVLNAQVSLPKQYVRLRILNAEIERSLNIGFSDNRTFWVIATDGGLVDAPVATTRLLMHVGERYEILVDLTNDTLGGVINLMSYNNSASLGTPLANSYPGGEPQTTGQFGSLLNNLDFNILRINIAAQTSSPVLTRPTTLTTNALWTTGDVTNPTTRTLAITGGAPGVFFFNTDQLFSPTVFNQTVNLNAVERWTITNTSGFSHSFHIHDIQFNLISRVSAGAGPASVTGIYPYEVGWKDTLYVQRNSSVTFLAKFDHFASNTNPFMYHCHFANHEDEGLMGQFVVVNNATEDLAVSSFTRTGNNSVVTLGFKATPGTTYTLQHSPDMTTNSWTDVGSVTSDGSSATFIETDSTRLGQPKGFYRVKIPTVP